jgi:urea transporter
MVQKAKNPHDLAVIGAHLAMLLASQRRYLSENARSRLRGSQVCFILIALALRVRVVAEPVLAFLLDHCQVGLAVMSTIVELSFMRIGV